MGLMGVSVPFCINAETGLLTSTKVLGATSWVSGLNVWWAVASTDFRDLAKMVHTGSTPDFDLSPAAGDQSGCIKKWSDTPCPRAQVLARCIIKIMKSNKLNDLPRGSPCYVVDAATCSVEIITGQETAIFVPEDCGS